jgi:hypothetical protein
MGKFFESLGAVLIAGLALAILIAVFPDSGYRPPTGDLLNGMLQWVHVFLGIVWIGLLYYFNFVQIPTMPKVPAELKPGISKHIAPAALFYFRWGAALTVLSGVALAESYGYLVEALTHRHVAGTDHGVQRLVRDLAEPETRARVGRGRRCGEGEVGANGDDLLAHQHLAVDPDAAGDDQRPLGCRIAACIL